MEDLLGDVARRAIRYQAGAPEVKVIVGAEAHPTLLKALGLLGSRS